MAETLNGNIDTLPELGTKAAAVAGIESMLYAAIRLREPFSPVQLRYWLDAYYQARIAAAGWTEARTPTPPTWDEIRDVLHRQAGWEDEAGPPRASAPTEEADRVSQKYEVIKIRAEDLEEARPVMEIIRDEIRRAAKAAGIEIEETDCRGASAPRNDRSEADGADVSAPP